MWGRARGRSRGPGRGRALVEARLRGVGGAATGATSPRSVPPRRGRSGPTACPRPCPTSRARTAHAPAHGAVDRVHHAHGVGAIAASTTQCPALLRCTQQIQGGAVVDGVGDVVERGGPRVPRCACRGSPANADQPRPAACPSAASCRAGERPGPRSSGAGRGSRTTACKQAAPQVYEVDCKTVGKDMPSPQ